MLAPAATELAACIARTMIPIAQRRKPDTHPGRARQSRHADRPRSGDAVPPDLRRGQDGRVALDGGTDRP